MRSENSDQLEWNDLTRCGACQSKNLTLVHDFGQVPLAGYFPKNEETPINLIPMKLIFCQQCTLHQISPDISDDYLFRDYRYISSIGMQDHFNELADWFVTKCNPKTAARILEFGCNDGPFLSALTKKGFNPIGIDPASNIVRRALEKGLVVIEDYFSLEAVHRYRELQNIDYIFSSNSFAHISDISSVAEAVSSALAPNGKFIVEVQSLVSLIKNSAFDFIYHEHKYYYTIESITRLMNRFDMYLEEVNLIPTHSGSYRLIFGKIEIEQSLTTKDLILEERDFLLNSGNIGSAIVNYENELRKFDVLIESLHSEGHRIIAFGASGRANMLLGKLEKSRGFIEKVIDESPERFGRQMAQNHIPIESLLGFNFSPYTIILILAWNYSDAIVRKLEMTNADLLIPLPSLKRIVANPRIGKHS